MEDGVPKARTIEKFLLLPEVEREVTASQTSLLSPRYVSKALFNIPT